jgi:hypothetical protein
VFHIEVNHVKSGFFFASKRNEIFASISNFASEAKVRAHPNPSMLLDIYALLLRTRSKTVIKVTYCRELAPGARAPTATNPAWPPRDSTAASAVPFRQTQGVTKRCRLPLVLVSEPNRGGSCGVSANEYSCTQEPK